MTKFRSALLALVLVVGGLVSVPAVATADPVQPAASYQCFYPPGPPGVIPLDCTVYSGYIRYWVRCSNGQTYYSPWSGSGRWYFTITCYPYTVIAWGIQTSG